MWWAFRFISRRATKFCAWRKRLGRPARFYVARGIRYALILDENFGNIPDHAEAVIELLARYGIRWLVQSRVDLFLRHFDDWLAKGMEGALFGIESFHQEVLKQIHKGEKVRPPCLSQPVIKSEEHTSEL